MPDKTSTAVSKFKEKRHSLCFQHYTTRNVISKFLFVKIVYMPVF